MSRDPYAIALGNAMTEIKKAFPEIQSSFIFAKDQKIITGNPETEQEKVHSILESFQAIQEKTQVIGNLKGFQITGKKGKLTVSNIEDMHLVLVTPKNVDTTHIHSITHVIIPTIIKSLETFATPHLQSPSTKKLIVETLSGFFKGDSVEIDTEVLAGWTMNDSAGAHLENAEQQNIQKLVELVKIETFSGNSALCKVKEIDDKKLKGQNKIRIPEKVCKNLEIKNGDLVKVKPMS